MFTKTAEYYDALYHFKDYKAACGQLHGFIQQQHPGASSLLDVGCGTGKHLEYLQENYTAEGLDLDAGLLGIARARCPGLKFHEANMISFDLESSFDVVVCLFSSIGYVGTVENLNSTLQALAKHLNPGGLLVIEPWVFPEKYWVDKLTANYTDTADLKIAWMYKSRLENRKSIFDIQYLVGSSEGISSFSEEHVMGLWTDAEYRQAMIDAGVGPVYDEKGFFGRGMYYGLKQTL